MEGLFYIDIISDPSDGKMGERIIRIQKSGIFTSVAMELTNLIVDILHTHKEEIKQIYEKYSSAVEFGTLTGVKKEVSELIVPMLTKCPGFRLSPWEFIGGFVDTKVRRQKTLLKLAADERWKTIEAILYRPRMTWALSDGLIASSQEAVKKLVESAPVNKGVSIRIYKSGMFTVDFGVIHKYNLTLAELASKGINASDIEWLPMAKMASCTEPLIGRDEWHTFVEMFERALKKGKTGIGAKDTVGKIYYEWIEI